MAIYRFPDNFWWGSATSAHQIEGDNKNDWSEWEIKRAKKEAEKAKSNPPAGSAPTGGWSESILNNYPNPLQEENYISGKACDSYNRYKEDFDIAKNLNHNIHRFSIEWSRIEPEEGRFDFKAMQHYIDVVKSLRERGIEPMITLWHFTNPIWFAKKGGFINLHSPEYFTRYAKYVVDNLRDQVGLWITFNEATTVYSGFAYLKGLWPPQHKSIFEWRRVNNNIIRAHIEAYKEIKRIYNYSPADFSKEVRPRISKEVELRNPSSMSHNVMVGLIEANAHVVVGNSFIKRIIGRVYNYYRNLYFYSKALPYYDFIGLNYYTIDRRIPGSYEVLPKQDFIEEMGWEIYPKGIYYRLLELRKFKKPLWITENGISDSTDKIRLKYIKDHLYWVHRAISEGADVRGYLYWSLLDNLELHRGFSHRFGLVEVDYKTFERRIRPSAWEYAKICKDNQLEID